MRVLAQVWQPKTSLGQAMAAYTGDIGPVGHSLPLRIAGGLHALVLTRRDEGLIAAYPPHTVDTHTLSSAVTLALSEHEAFLMEWAKSPPQTNEVRRSAVLIAGALVALSHFQRPIVLSELGGQWRFESDVGSL